MPIDYTGYTDIFLVTKDDAALREYPEPDALALVALKRGQQLRRLDTIYWNGAWIRFYADVPGGRKYEGYLHAQDVEDTDDVEAPPAAPAPPSAGQAAPAQPPAPAPTQPPPTAAQPPAPAPIPAPAPQSAPAAAGPMITLGCVDAGVSDQACAAYLGVVEQTTRRKLAEVAPGLDKIATTRMPPPASGAMTIAQVQQGLHQLGFFPGGEADGICGYRTTSAIRLFQEYVRSVEGVKCLPDGHFGPQTQAQLQRWLSSGARPDWSPKAGEYEAWLGLLQAVKQKYTATPSRVLELVNAFAGQSDTRKVRDWDFTGPGNIHLIGVRRNEAANKFDDIFVLLIKGLVFKFQGSTEPGASEHPDGPPHLTPGQHDYHFGWHKRTYLALRPRGAGVLVVRAGADRKLDDTDLARGVHPEPTINIHWGGRGMAGDVNNWSEGCQVINGTVYVNPGHQLISCAEFAAVGSKDPTTRPEKTRGAYNVLVDLVTALSGDMTDNGVKYTLLTEPDLELAPVLKQTLAAARDGVIRMVG